MKKSHKHMPAKMRKHNLPGVTQKQAQEMALDIVNEAWKTIQAAIDWRFKLALALAMSDVLPHFGSKRITRVIKAINVICAAYAHDLDKDEHGAPAIEKTNIQMEEELASRRIFLSREELQGRK